MKIGSDPKETSAKTQDVDSESMKYIKYDKHDPSWAAQEGPLFIPASSLNSRPCMRSTETSMDILFQRLGVGLIPTEKR